MSDDEDDYVAFGVALKPLEEKDNIRKKPIAVEEQIVRDVNGIRRFHGAFTGGFSAGHFNTVNTPQGWYPKQFKSSREAKSDKTNQKPEDFMDDEDVGAFGFAAQALKTKSNFQRGAEPSAPPQTGAGRSAIPLGGLLEQLVKPANSTVGETLLIRQGWRPGSGVGPRATKTSKVSRLASHVKTYGCTMPGTSTEEDTAKDEVDPMMEKYQDFLFAPDEIPLNIANPKDNFFGIGYSGLARPGGGEGGGSGYSVRTSLNTSNSRKKFSISGEAFGVGADEEDDDMEVYNRGDMAQYDFSLDIRGEDRRERREEKGSRWDNSGKRTEKRGMEEMAGFSPATSSSMIKKHYPSPQLPPSWRPRAAPGQRQKPSRFAPADVAQVEKEDTQGRKSRWDQKGTGSGTNPSIDQRRAKLFPDECNQSNNDTKEESEAPVELPDFLRDYQPKQEDRIGGQVPFKPFARNEAKQLRYEQYLVCVANNRREALPILQPKSMTEWEKERERVEFERASMLFKPMKGVIGSRFVSAGESEDADKGEEGLHGGGDDGEGQARRAADMKMFGQLTRTVEEWHPAKLVCVRFNVAHPYGDYTVVGTREKPKRDTGVTNVFAMVGVEDEGGSNSSQKEIKDESQIKEEPGEPIIPVKEDEPVQVKPPADLFKAIFVDSDSESDSDSEQDIASTSTNLSTTTTSKPGNHLPTPVVTSVPRPWEQKEGNILRSKEPARGIFANIDLDSLNRKQPEKDKVIKDAKDNRRTEPSGKSGGLSVVSQTVRTVLGIRKEVVEDDSEEEFGPKLPPVMVQKSIVISSDSEGESDKREKKKKSKDKKKHKEKKKYKDKKEKKKKSRNHSSSDSSGDRKRRRHDREDSLKHKKRRRHSSSSG